MIPATHAQTTIEVPAHLGWRLLAQLVDLTIVVFAFGLVVSIYMASGIDVDREMEDGWLMEITFGALVFCYFVVFEALLSATPGKMAAGLRVTMHDGSRLTGPAVILRNLVRLPELMLWYIPSIISVAASSERRRIGDFAARTIVLRRQRLQPGRQGQPVWSYGLPPAPGQPGWQGQAVWSGGLPPAPGQPPVGAPGQPSPRVDGPPGPAGQEHPAAPGQPPLVAGQPGLLVDRVSLAADACLTAAHNLANAENAYRLMAEREHLRLVEFGLLEAGSEALSGEYVHAWDAFAEAVVGLQQSYHRLAEVLGGWDVGTFVATRPPLVQALRAVDEYLPAASDDDVVAVFRRRLEAAHS